MHFQLKLFKNKLDTEYEDFDKKSLFCVGTAQTNDNTFKSLPSHFNHDNTALLITWFTAPVMDASFGTRAEVSVLVSENPRQYF